MPAEPDELQERNFPFWRTIFSFIRPFKGRLLVSIVCAMIVGATNAVQPLFIKWLIDDAILAEVDGQPLAPESKMKLAVILVAVFLGTCVLRITVGVYGYRKMVTAIEGFLCELRGRFFRHVQHLCLRFHDEVASGELFNYIMGSPVQSLKMFLNQAALNIPIQAVSWAVALGALAKFNLPMTLITLVTVVIMVLLNNHSRIKIREMSADFMKTESYVSKYVADMLRGCRAIKVYAIEDNVSGSFDGYIDHIRNKGVILAYRRQIESVKAEAVRYIGMAVVFVCGSYYCLYKDMSTGSFAAFVTSINLLMQPLMQLVELNLVRGNAEAGLQRIVRILNRVQTTGELPQSQSCRIHQSAIAARQQNMPCFEFKTVSFGYDAERPVLQNLDLTIEDGQTVALAGPSGSGKTTFISLLLRLYDPQSGQIILNGHSIGDYALKDLRSSYGVVPQDPYLFQGTIRDNIRVTRPDATADEVNSAIEMAYVSEFVAELPKGLDTMVGEGGANLSGGQRQRIAIARAILSNPLYYIFDEATSALDNRSEKRIQQAMESLTASHTSFIIAHRLSTIRNVDRILVFEDGLLVQDGNFDQLSSSDGLFKTMLGNFA